MMHTNRQTGVALALILWFIAALALLVAGLMALSRAEVSNARLYLAQAQAAAVGDGVAVLASRGMYRRVPGSDLLGKQPFDTYSTTLRFVPASGLIDVTTADPELLQLLFVAATQLQLAQARELVDSVLQWRAVSEEQKSQRHRTPVAHVLEDIMLVPGLSRAVFEQLRWYVCAGCNNGSFNWQHAPAEVGALLADSPWSEAEAETADAGDWLQLSGAGRVDARVKMPDGSVFQRSVWLSKNGTFSRRYTAFRVKQLEFESNNRVQ